MVRGRNFLTSCIKVIVLLLRIWQTAGEVWPGKILLHVNLSDGPHSSPIHSPIPKVLPAKSLTKHEILSLRGTRERDFNCCKVSPRLPKALLSQCHPIYVNMGGVFQSLPKEMENYNYFDYQLGLS